MVDVDRVFLQIKDGAHDFPRKALAWEVSKEYTTLSNEINEVGGFKLGLRTFLKVLAVTKNLKPLDTIEAGFGRVAFPLPKVEATISDLYKMSLKAVREFGEMIGEMEQALSDDDLTEAEVKKIKTEGHEAIRAIVALLEALPDKKGGE